LIMNLKVVAALLVAAAIGLAPVLAQAPKSARGESRHTPEREKMFAGDWPADRAICRPVPLTHVRPDGFLGRRILQNRESLLKGLDSPIPRRFEALVSGRQPGPETNRLASDSDLYKWIEGASYMVALRGDTSLEQQLDRISRLVVACQKDDGYINTQAPPNVRFDPKVNHDLYCAGHFFEAAVARYRATAKKDLLDAAARWADYLIAEYDRGNPYFRNIGQDEHSEYELGLVRLARATGQKRYLDFGMALSRAIPVGTETLSGKYAKRNHAVRINYFLVGAAELFMETGRPEFGNGLRDIWNDIATRRSYVTGGVSLMERYQAPYFLPQHSADSSQKDIAETCTSISLMMLAWRLHAITGESGFYDYLEKTLYNHYLGGPSLDNLSTFYYNPLRMLDPEKRADLDGPAGHRTMLPAIHRTSCCITNEWRFFGALSEYLFSYDDKGLYVNLFTASRLHHVLANGAEVALSVDTNYPHDGNVRLVIENARPATFTLRIRVPRWSTQASLAVNGERPQPVKEGAYAVLNRTWKQGDSITLRMPMPPRMIVPDSREEHNAGQAIVGRGPLVYCLEQRDATYPIQQARWNFSPDQASRRVRAEWRKDTLGGVYVLTAPGLVQNGPSLTKTDLTLVPFYARANRGENNRWLTFLPLPGTRPSQSRN